MGSERDDLKNIEDGKIGIMVTGIAAVIGIVAKFFNDNSKQNKINELSRERDGISGKLFKSQQEKSRIKEIDDKITKLKK